MRLLRNILRDWPLYTMFACCLFMVAAYLSLRLEPCPHPHKFSPAMKSSPSPSASSQRATAKADASKPAAKPKNSVASQPVAGPQTTIASMPAGKVWVKGYYRKDGRWVELYIRKAPGARQG